MKLTSYQTDKQINVKVSEIKDMRTYNLNNEKVTILYMKDGTEIHVKESALTIKRFINQ